MKRSILLIAAVIAVGIFWCHLSVRQGGKIKVAILQTASHPALDQARDGFITKLRQDFGDDIGITVQNAEGLLPQARTIAKRFHLDRDVKLIFTIGSPATQMMAEVERSKPIIFSAVTDLEALGLSNASLNMTGCRDGVNVNETVSLVRTLVPDARTVALLSNPSELNSVVQVSQLRSAFQNQGMEVIEIGVYQESEASTATVIAANKSDVIVTPTDNLVAATVTVIARQALRLKTPLIVSDNLLVPQGPLAAKGVDYGSSGQRAGAMAAKILRGEATAKEIPIEDPVASSITINTSTLSSLQLSVPDGLQFANNEELQRCQ